MMRFFSKYNPFKKPSEPIEPEMDVTERYPELVGLVAGSLDLDVMALHCDVAKSILSVIMAITSRLLKKNAIVRIILSNAEYTLNYSDVKRISLIKLNTALGDGTYLEHYRLDILRQSPTDPNLIEIVKINPGDFQGLELLHKDVVIDLGTLIPGHETYGVVIETFKALREIEEESIDIISDSNVLPFKLPLDRDTP